MDRAASEIIKILESNGSSGHDPREHFNDWIQIVEVWLRMRIVNAEALLETGAFAPDSDEDAAFWARMKKRHPNGYEWDAYMAAYKILLKHDNLQVDCDILGPVFQELGNANVHAGQFFTPWPICTFLARTSMTDIVQMVCDALNTAMEKSELGRSLHAGGLRAVGEHTAQYITERYLGRFIEHYEPVTVHDPCIGSGGMLIAAAAALPSWMVVYGVVQFYGCDIDARCVTMARCNFMLFRLNGLGLRWHLLGLRTAAKYRELNPDEPDTLETPASPAALPAHEAIVVGSEPPPAVIAASATESPRVVSVREVQLDLFGNPA